MKKKMTKIETKLDKEIKKNEKILEGIIFHKTKALVRAKRAEYWIKDHQEEYQKVLKNYNRSKFSLQNLFEFKRMPFLFRIIPEIILFIQNPIKYIRFRPGTTRHMIEAYWSFKEIKKEWEDDFNFTEKKIDEDFAFVEKSETYIKKTKQLLERGYKIFSKKQEQDTND